MGRGSRRSEGSGSGTPASAGVATATGGALKCLSGVDLWVLVLIVALTIGEPLRAFKRVLGLWTIRYRGPELSTVHKPMHGPWTAKLPTARTQPCTQHALSPDRAHNPKAIKVVLIFIRKRKKGVLRKGLATQLGCNHDYHSVTDS